MNYKESLYIGLLPCLMVATFVLYLIDKNYDIHSPLMRIITRQNSIRNRRIVCTAAGTLNERVREFSNCLNRFRDETLPIAEQSDWQRPSHWPTIVRGKDDDYMDKLVNYSQVTTVVLPWSRSSGETWSSLADTSNLLIQKYYEWTADNRLCSWVETPGVIRMRYDAVFDRKCNRNINDTVHPSSLRPVFLNAKPLNPARYWPNKGRSYPRHFYTDTPLYVFYMHIHRDAVVTQLGDVISGNLKLVLLSCTKDLRPSLPGNIDKAPLYDEIFVISHYWGNAVFHRMVEIIPRIALYLDFLKSNPEIRILALQTGGRLAEILDIMGLDKSRLVKGTARAKIVYQPRATACGFANVPESQVLSQIYRDYIRRTFPPLPKNRLILIRRSGKRRFTEQGEIEKVLERAATDYNLTFTMFIDNPVPSLNDTMMMFNAAVMVVAPHGAGLANLFFSAPGTYVIEGVCNLPHVNLCFLRLVHILGHHWHGLTSRRGCESVVDVAAAQIAAAARQYLELWSSKN